MWFEPGFSTSVDVFSVPPDAGEVLIPECVIDPTFRVQVAVARLR